MSLQKDINLMEMRGFSSPTAEQVHLYKTLGERGYFRYYDHVLDEVIMFYTIVGKNDLRAFMDDFGRSYINQRTLDLSELILNNPDQDIERLEFLTHLTDEEVLNYCFEYESNLFK